ncbi:hypothetical protein VKT23_003507 [Stygiomarasmius scandens]|uniref:Homeobox domain-containing protein n=1 Tax=Marasmiellus scandens TaxID=2682957 RepID=A0ABR1K1I4_9AGAR
MSTRVVVRATKDQKKALADFFEQNPDANKASIQQLGETLGLTEKWIRGWKQRHNKRQRDLLREDQPSSDPSIMQFKLEYQEATVPSEPEPAPKKTKPKKRKTLAPKTNQNPIAVKTETLDIPLLSNQPDTSHSAHQAIDAAAVANQGAPPGAITALQDALYSQQCASFDQNSSGHYSYFERDAPAFAIQPSLLHAIRPSASSTPVFFTAPHFSGRYVPTLTNQVLQSAGRYEFQPTHELQATAQAHTPTAPVPSISPIFDTYYEYPQDVFPTNQDADTSIRDDQPHQSTSTQPARQLPDYTFLQRIVPQNSNTTLDQNMTPLKHLNVLEPLINDQVSRDMSDEQLLETVKDRLLDENLLQEDPFQAAMGLVFLARTFGV